MSIWNCEERKLRAKYEVTEDPHKVPGIGGHRPAVCSGQEAEDFAG
ncbi:MAG: hypothetical protein LAO03_20280 [Acidobacteriia bacterium]|nr:hypothetical protein [Terriglobia bacterium]